MTSNHFNWWKSRLRSMRLTRSCDKSTRKYLAFIVDLAFKWTSFYS